MATRKQITNDWQQLFPELKKTGLLSLDNRLGPLITGIYIKVVRNTYYTPVAYVHNLCSEESGIITSLECTSETIALEKQEERVVIEGSEKNSEENLEEKREVKEVEPIVEEDKINDRDMEQSKEELLKNVNVDDDNYITYKVHIVKQEDTEESIMLKYNITMDDLKEYNNYTNLSLGDKLIIPVVNE